MIWERENSHLVWLTRSALPPCPSWGISCVLYISLLGHPPPTLISYPCLYLSVRPINHSFWCPVSCCDPDSTVQGSRPHQWGQDVSCGYLIRRWQFLLELLFYHAPIAWPIALETSFGMLEETAFGGMALSPSVISVCRGQGCPQQYILAVWILFVRPWTFLPPRHGPWAQYEMGRGPRSFGPTINLTW